MANTKTSNIELVAILILVFIGVHIVNVLLKGQLEHYGIIPGNINSLPHILSSPFIHGGWLHLSNNIVGFAIFASLTLLKSRRFFIYSSIFIIIFGGLLVWIFGREASHIGASGWVFGLWALTIANAYFDRSFTNFCIAVFVVLVYGGMAMGMLPTSAAISFEAHIFGAISGVAAAKLFRYYRT